MNSMKKRVALLIVLVLCMSFCTQVLAVSGTAGGQNGQIIITQAVKGAEYKAYRLFDLKYNSQTQSHSYTVAAAWKPFVEQDAISGTNGYLQATPIGDQIYITWKKQGTEEEQTAFAAEFAKLALAYARNPENHITPDRMTVGTVNQESCTAQFDNLAYGYYLVDTSVGSLCMLDSTNPNFTAADKSTAPKLQKNVKEGQVWGKTNDGSIGDTIEFKASITVGKGAENYVLKDKMGKAFDFVELTHITRKSGTNPQEVTIENPQNKNYSVRQDADSTFVVQFTNEYLKTLSPGDTLTVYYKGVLNEQAEIRTQETANNKNKAWLQYGHSAQVLMSAPSETHTQTWDFKIHKYTMNAQKEQPLAGATFSLHQGSETGEVMNFTKTDTAGTYRVCTRTQHSTEHEHITELTTGEDGNLHIQGLDSGVYYLEETKAPEGYNKLKDPVKIQIGTKGEINQQTANNGNITVNIENKFGSELPSTGGTGTVLFYVGGTVLVIFAGVMLVLKKRCDRKKEK